MLAAGTNVDGFVLVRVLGEGPLGITWLARDARRGTPATVKLLAHPSRNAFAKLVAAMKTTAHSASPRVQAVLRSVQEPDFGALGIALEHIEGKTFEQVEIDPQKLALYLRWFESLARTLGELHAKGIAHGSVKPTNVIVTNDGEVRVLDLVWAQLRVEPAAPVDDLRALAATFERVVLRKLPSVPSVLARVKAATADDLARAIQSARVMLEDETTDRNARALVRVATPDTMRLDVHTHSTPESMEQPVAVEVVYDEEDPAEEHTSATVALTAMEREAARTGISALAAWGLVLLSISALVVITSLWWFRAASKDHGHRTMRVINDEDPDAPKQGLVESENPDAALELQPAEELEAQVRTVEPVVLSADFEKAGDKPDAGKKRKIPAIKDAEVECDEGDGAACVRLGDLLRDEATMESLDRAKLAFERGCAFSRPSGCVKAAEVAESNSSFENARALYERACSLRNAAACHKAADMWREGRGGNADDTYADDLEKKACRHGRKDSCPEVQTSTS